MALDIRGFAVYLTAYVGRYQKFLLLLVVRDKCMENWSRVIILSETLNLSLETKRVAIRTHFCPFIATKRVGTQQWQSEFT